MLWSLLSLLAAVSSSAPVHHWTPQNIVWYNNSQDLFDYCGSKNKLEYFGLMDEDQSIDDITEEDTDIGVTLEEIIDPPGQNKQNL